MLTTLLNLTYALTLIHCERAQNISFRCWLKNYRTSSTCIFLLSPIHTGLIKLINSRLFYRESFGARLLWSDKNLLMDIFGLFIMIVQDSGQFVTLVRTLDQLMP